MDPRPIDGYRDVHPWPYEWRTDFSESVLRFLDIFDDRFPFIEVWTYLNHWRAVNYPVDEPHRWVVDFYQGGTADQRAWLPIQRGDEIADYLVAEWADCLKAVLWNHYIWTPEFGWDRWTGPQGDFVEHVHAEFDKQPLIDRLGPSLLRP